MDADNIREIANRLIDTGLCLSGLREIMQMLGEGHRNVRGDVFCLLEQCLNQYTNTVLAEAGNLKNMIGEV